MRTYLFVAYHVAAANLAKARKNELQILAARHGVELADEEHVFGRLDVGVRQVADDFERQGGGFRVSPAFDGLFLVVFGPLPCLVVGVRVVSLAPNLPGPAAAMPGSERVAALSRSRDRKLAALDKFLKSLRGDREGINLCFKVVLQLK